MLGHVSRNPAASLRPGKGDPAPVQTLMNFGSEPEYESCWTGKKGMILNPARLALSLFWFVPVHPGDRQGVVILVNDFLEKGDYAPISTHPCCVPHGD